MEFQEALEKRRSVRKYQADGMPKEEELKTFIAAALEDPTWKNTETGRYYCILSESMAREFRDCNHLPKRHFRIQQSREDSKQ